MAIDEGEEEWMAEVEAIADFGEENQGSTDDGGGEAGMEISEENEAGKAEQPGLEMGCAVEMDENGPGGLRSEMLQSEEQSSGEQEWRDGLVQKWAEMR